MFKLCFALLFLYCEAIPTRLQEPNHLRLKQNKRWDVAESVTFSSWKSKTEAHENIVKIAYQWVKAKVNKKLEGDKQLGASSVDVPLWTPHESAAIIIGLQWPDMPCTDCITVKRAGTMAFATDYKLNQGLTDESHFGCLQYWHAMCPRAYTLTRGPGGITEHWLLFENSHVAEQILVELEFLFDRALNLRNQGKQDEAEFILGRILHTIADSYAAGHTVRLTTDATSDFKCGDIYQMQGYESQDSDQHEVYDHIALLKRDERSPEEATAAQIKEWCNADKTDPRICDLYLCAISRSAAVLKIYLSDPDDARTEFKQLIQEIFRLHSGRGQHRAGGSLRGMQKQPSESIAELDDVCESIVAAYEDSDFVNKNLCKGNMIELYFTKRLVHSVEIPSTAKPPPFEALPVGTKLTEQHYREASWVCNPLHPKHITPDLQGVLVGLVNFESERT